MKNTLALLLLWCTGLLQAFGQQGVTNTSILLVPFQPEFYLSDAERDIMAQTHQTPDAYRQYFRRVLDLKIQAELEDLGPCHSLLQDTTTAGRSRLENFYARVAYSYAHPVGPRRTADHDKRKEGKASGLHPDPHTAPQSISTRGDARFMQAEIRDTAWLRQLCELHQAEWIVAINQFEIKTNYNSCIDIANKIYRRELLIHYSILKADGRQYRGNFLMDFFPSGSNRDTEIAERVFPVLAKSLKEEVKDVAGISEKERK
ncbi:MAG: hypothetical protein JNL88_08055 [Bacteroidia bacterium]|nr:hypothetical protein [Bacteroidia bacterium]